MSGDRNADSQFDGFVPHDDVAWETEGLHVDDVDVSSFRADVQPFALKGQVAVCDSAPGGEKEGEGGRQLFIISWLNPIKESPLVPNHADPTGRSSEWLRFNYKRPLLCVTLMKPDYLYISGGASKHCCLSLTGGRNRSFMRHIYSIRWTDLMLTVCCVKILVCAHGACDGLCNFEGTGAKRLELDNKKE